MGFTELLSAIERSEDPQFRNEGDFTSKQKFEFWYFPVFSWHPSRSNWNFRGKVRIIDQFKFRSCNRFGFLCHGSTFIGSDGQT